MLRLKIWSKIQQMPKLALRDYTMIGVGIGISLLVIGAYMVVHNNRVPLAPAVNNIAIPWIPDSVKRWRGQIETSAKKYNIDPNLVAIIMIIESGGYAKADSGQAQGLMQITPATAKEIATKRLKKPVTNYDIWDPATNIEFGTAYLAYLRDVFGETNQGPSWNVTAELVAAGYNGGPGAANSLYKGTGLTDTQTVVYSRDVYNMWRERKAPTSPTFDRWKERGGQTLLDKAAQNM
jgi:soluble lytic murein transglycosylase-like protein